MIAVSSRHEAQSNVMNVAIVTPRKQSVQLEAELRKRFAVQLKKLRASWRFHEAESPMNAVHDLRVASRRLRAFADVVEHGLGRRAGRRFRRRLAKIARGVSDLRNADVLALLVEHELAMASDTDRASIEHLLERLDRSRRAAERKARDQLDRVDLAVLMARLSADMDAALRRSAHAEPSLAAFGVQHVEQRRADVLERLPQPGAAAPSDEELHRLRIAVKKLRYAAELFDSVLGRRGTELRGRMPALQEQLGRRHDLAVLIEMVTAELAKLDARGRRALARGLRSLLTSLEARCEQPDYSTLLATS
jgi:CHAD domain-containing protein